MKKLMIAAAAAAMAGGLYADNICVEETPVAVNSCSFFDVKFTFKTLGAKDAKCTAAQLGAQNCQQILNNGQYAGIAYLDNTTRTFNGIMWQCTAACLEGVLPNNAEGGAELNYVLWDKKNKKAISPYAIATVQQDGTHWSAVAATENTKFDILGRYGAKASKVAAYWVPTMKDANEVITAAGFGTFDAKTKLVKSVSGNAVAKLVPVAFTQDASTICQGNTVTFATVFAYLCHNFTSWCCCDCVQPATVVPASGTWSVKYNASKSKKAKLSDIIPDGMVQGAAQPW